MPTRRCLSATAVAALLAFSQTSATAQMTRGEITLEKAREILRANPVAIPGYPVRFYLLHGRAILVLQEVDSGRVISLREDRGGPPNFSGPRPFTDQDGAQQALWGVPTRFEQRYWARQRYGEIGGVSVRYLGSLRMPIPHDLLDRLAPIP